MIARITIAAALVSGLALAASSSPAQATSQTAPMHKTMFHHAKGSSVSMTDKSFMNKAAVGGIAEVQMGNLALQKASDQAVRSHAQHMIDDHTKANDELKSIAQSKGVKLPTQPDAKDKALIGKLGRLSGKDFDRTYIKEGGVKAHQQMASLFRSEKSKTKDPQVKDFASRTLPVIEEHLKDSQNLANGSAR
ncbi:MAG TPA: DUF4142 domain-containing protein [Candidatus Binatia bacterium]|jgi:putative membrane protein